MKFIDNKFYWEQGLKEWHRWFAWRPVLVQEVSYDEIRVPRHRVWLEDVERRRFSGEEVNYRTPAADSTIARLPFTARRFEVPVVLGTLVISFLAIVFL